MSAAYTLRVCRGCRRRIGLHYEVKGPRLHAFALTLELALQHVAKAEAVRLAAHDWTFELRDRRVVLHRAHWAGPSETVKVRSWEQAALWLAAWRARREQVAANVRRFAEQPLGAA